MSRPTRSDHRSEAGEADPGRLLPDLRAVRKPAGIAVLVVSLAYLGFWVLKEAMSPSLRIWSTNIQLTFEGADRNRYPDGTTFVVQDLVTPRLLRSVYEINRIADHGVLAKDFVQSLNVRRWSPDYEIIVEKYNRLLSQKKLTPAQIEILHKEMREELGQSSSRSVILSFLPPRHVRLPEGLVEKILLDIPRLWSETAVNERDVLKLDVPVYSEALFDEERFRNLDVLFQLDLMREYLDRFADSIREMLNLPNAKTVRDRESGLTLLDVNEAIYKIRGYDIKRLSAKVINLGISEDIVELRRQLERRIHTRREQARFAQALAKSTREALLIYLRDSGRVLEGAAPSAEPGVAAPDIVQLGVNRAFMDKLTELIEKSRDMEFRQDLTDRMLARDQRATDLARDVAVLEDQLLSIGVLSDAQEDSTEHHFETTKREIRSILGTLRAYATSVRNIHDLLSRENLGHAGTLYTIDGKQGLSVSGGIPWKRALAIWGLLAGGAAGLVVLLALWFRRGDEVEPSSTDTPAA